MHEAGMRHHKPECAAEGDSAKRVPLAHLLVEAVLRKTHEGSLLLHKEHEAGLALDVLDAVNETGNRLATHAHLCAIDKVAVLEKVDAPHHDALLEGKWVWGSD